MATFDPNIISIPLSEVVPEDAVVETLGEDAKICLDQLATNCRECVFNLDCPVALSVGDRRRI